MLKPAHATCTFLINMLQKPNNSFNGRRNSFYSAAYFGIRYCMSNINTAPKIFISPHYWFIRNWTAIFNAVSYKNKTKIRKNKWPNNLSKGRHYNRKKCTK